VPAGTIPAIAATAAVVLILTTVQARSDPSVFDRYLGRLRPVPVVLGVAAAAFGSLPYLASRGWPVLPGPDPVADALVVSAVAVAVLLVSAIGADLLLRFPAGMNVPLPDALLFYPSVGFVVEICFHAVPLAVLVAVFGGTREPSEAAFWLMVIPIASIEAAFQAAIAERAATAAFSFAQLLLFGAVQLYVFARFGFLPMYAFRLVYYLGWHVLWGAARLRLLF
jgi:hypothetical protein